MAWQIVANDGQSGFTLVEPVPFVFPKTLTWGTDLPALAGGHAAEIVGVRTFLGTSHVAGTRALKLVAQNADGSVHYEAASADTLAADLAMTFQWGDLGTAGLTTAPNIKLDRLQPSLFMAPGQRLTCTHNGTNEINTITANASPSTGGTFTITVDGQTTAPIAFNADAPILYDALLALSNVAPGDVHVVFTTGTNLSTSVASAKIMWAGAMGSENVTISIDTTLLTGGLGPHVLATTTAGVGFIDAADTLIMFVQGRVIR